MDQLTALCAQTAELAAPEGGAPEWVHILPLGRIEGRDGRVFVLDKPDRVIAAFMKGAVDLPIDYDHAIDDPEARPAKEPVKAAGWIKELEVREDGIWGRAEWTKTAANSIAEKEFRYLSPVINYAAEDGRVIQLQGASLVHRPNLHLKALNRVDPEVPAPSVLTQIAEALDLPTDADAATILTSLNRLKEPDPAKFMPVEAVQALLSERATMTARMSQMEAEDRVDEAMREGFISPAMRPWAVVLCRRDKAAFDGFLTAAPPTFKHLHKMTEGPTRKGVLRINGEIAGTVEDEIAARLGIDPAAMR